MYLYIPMIIVIMTGYIQYVSLYTNENCDTDRIYTVCILSDTHTF